MSLQFSRSIRSLSTDSYRAAKVGMILMMLVIISLVVWFFSARVTLFARSSGLSLTDHGRLLAVFPKESIGQVRPGQAAILRIRPDPNEKPVSAPAIVYAIDSQNNQAEIVLLSEDLPPEVSVGALSGDVSVEVEYVTPISFVLRTLGYRVDQREVPVSPQLDKELNP